MEISSSQAIDLNWFNPWGIILLRLPLSVTELETLPNSRVKGCLTMFQASKAQVFPIRRNARPLHDNRIHGSPCTRRFHDVRCERSSNARSRWAPAVRVSFERSPQADPLALRPVRAFCKRSLALTLQEPLVLQPKPSFSLCEIVWLRLSDGSYALSWCAMPSLEGIVATL